MELNERTKTYYKSLVKVVENLIDCKPYNSKRDALQEYEHQIDQMVYELYGLTKKEIEIVENSEEK